MTLKFGVFIPQGWKMELSSIDDPQAKWAKACEIARRAEELNFDSLWVYDHFHNVPKPAHETMFECWTTMAAMTQVTSRIMLGQMVSCAGYREPSLVAKITSNIDVMSGGRLIWGIGAGWYEHEYKAYGYDFPSAGARLKMMEETIEIVTRMWSDADASFSGKYFSIDGAQCDPKPVQARPQVLVGGGGEKVTLRIVARHADASNFGGKANEFAHKCDVLKQHCKDVGRDYDEIEKTWSPEIFIRDNEADVDEIAAVLMAKRDGGIRRNPSPDRGLEDWKAGNLVGTPDQVAHKIGQYRDMGCTGFYPWCSDYPDTETMELFATRVIPELR